MGSSLLHLFAIINREFPDHLYQQQPGMPDARLGHRLGLRFYEDRERRKVHGDQVLGKGIRLTRLPGQYSDPGEYTAIGTGYRLLNGKLHNIGIILHKGAE